MRLSFEFDKYKVTYDVMFKKRRDIAINVDAEGKVSVLAPLGTSVQTIADKVKGHGAWILYEINKQGKLNELARVEAEKSEVTQCLYLGKNYGIEKVENTKVEMPLVKLKGKFVVEAPTFDKQTVREALCVWYKEKTLVKLKERLKLYQSHFDKVPAHIQVELLDKALFKISEDTLVFSPNTIVPPLYVMDTFLVEALCYFNQITDVKAMHEQLEKQYEDARKWVNENAKTLIFF